MEPRSTNESGSGMYVFDDACFSHISKLLFMFIFLNVPSTSFIDRISSRQTTDVILYVLHSLPIDRMHAQHLTWFYHLCSKRRFSEQLAEEWWKENRDRLLRKYATTLPTRTAAPLPLPPPEAAGVPQPPGGVAARQQKTPENNEAAA